MYTFEKVCLDPTLAEAFQEKFSQELKKNETREFMDQELEALTETVLRIKQDFEQVSGNLLRLDERNFINKQVSWSGVSRMVPPIPLHQEWKKFQKVRKTHLLCCPCLSDILSQKFNGLLTESKTTAEKAFYQVLRSSY